MLQLLYLSYDIASWDDKEGSSTTTDEQKSLTTAKDNQGCSSLPDGDRRQQITNFTKAGPQICAYTK